MNKKPTTEEVHEVLVASALRQNSLLDALLKAVVDLKAGQVFLAQRLGAIERALGVKGEEEAPPKPPAATTLSDLLAAVCPCPKCSAARAPGEVQ